MTKSLYKVSLSGEVGGAEAGARTGTGGEGGGMGESGRVADRATTRRSGECGVVEVEKKPTMGMEGKAR